MNQKGFVNVLIIVIVAVIAGAVVYFALTRVSKEQEVDTIQSPTIEDSVTPSPKLSESDVPQNVTEKYQELAKIYEKSLGASLVYCTKGNLSIYYVSGSGGYTGVRFYYDDNGNELENYSYSDDRPDLLPKSSIDISEYECTILKPQILAAFKFIETTVDISNWQTYRNEQNERFGFELRYPPTWEVVNNYEIINPNSPVGSPLQKVIPSVTERSSGTLLLEDAAGAPLKKILLDGWPAVQLDLNDEADESVWGLCCTFITLLFKSGVVFQFWTFYDLPTREQYLSDHNQILSTFKFIN